MWWEGNYQHTWNTIIKRIFYRWGTKVARESLADQNSVFKFANSFFLMFFVHFFNDWFLLRIL